MGAYDFLKRLKETGFASQTLDIPFLLHAMEEGLVDDPSLKKIEVLLSEELGGSSSLFVQGLASLGFPTHAQEIAFYADDYTPEASFELAHKELKKLYEGYPVTATAYNFWLEDLTLQSQSDDSENNKREIRWRVDFLTQTIRSEIIWQEILENHFWNAIFLGVLQSVAPGALPTLINAHRHFEAVEDLNTKERFLTADERDAFAVQMSLLGAAIMLELNRRGVVPRVKKLGPKVTIEIEGRNETVSFSVPLYNRLDQVVNAVNHQIFNNRLVSLPADIKLIGKDQWEHLMNGPFFVTHPRRLLPSNAFWGMEFPKRRPNQAKLASLLAREIPPYFGRLSLSQMKMLLGEEQIKKSSVAFIGEPHESGRTQLYHAYVEGREGHKKSRYVVEYGSVISNAFKKEVELRMNVDGGTVTQASYLIHTKPPLIVDVDRERIDTLVARARKGYTPYSGGGMSSGVNGDQDGSNPITGFKMAGESSGNEILPNSQITGGYTSNLMPHKYDPMIVGVMGVFLNWTLLNMPLIHAPIK